MGSLSQIKPYFRTQLDALEYHEHKDGFFRNNIPETVLDKSYHLLVGPVVGGPVSHTHQTTDTEVSVALYLRGYRSSEEAIDQALLAMDTIIKNCCKIKNR